MKNFQKNLTLIKENHLKLISVLDNIIEQNKQTEETVIINEIIDNPSVCYQLFEIDILNLNNLLNLMFNLRHAFLDDGSFFLFREEDVNANQMLKRVLTKLNKVEQYKPFFHYKIQENKNEGIFITSEIFTPLFRNLSRINNQKENVYKIKDKKQQLHELNLLISEEQTYLSSFFEK